MTPLRDNFTIDIFYKRYIGDNITKLDVFDDDDDE